jgi:hypothetical protein
MYDMFSDLRVSWKRLATELPCQYSEDCPSYVTEGRELYKPPTLTFVHRGWTIVFDSMFFTPKVWLLPARYMVSAESKLIAKKQFDVDIGSTETFSHRMDKLQPLFEPLRKGRPKSESDEAVRKKFFPVERHPARTNITEIDLHYEVVSANTNDPKIIFDDSEVREAFLAIPKAGVRICGFPGMDRSYRDIPFLSNDHIGSTEFMRASDKDRIVQIVRLHRALLDRLDFLAFISSSSR